MTPLLARGEILGGLYIRISADAIREKKAKVAWFFCLGAVLAIVLTTLIEVVVVHKMFVPRIDHAATVLQQYAGGDFSSRITHTGAPDQLGRLMQRVNHLLETIEEYTGMKQAQLAAEAAAETRLLLVEDLEKKNRLLQDTLDELKNTQLQLVQSEKMAAVGMTAGGVAHDLNNILAGVVSYPELLLATLPAENEVRKPLELILASGRRAVAVVADLLTLAKGSARAKQHVRLDRLVEEYLHSVEFRQMMRDLPQVQVVTEYEAEQYSINCSPVHIQKAIMNLVMNAVEAVMPSGGTVALRTRHAGGGDAGGCSREEFVVLEVHDDGP
ncbi:MAG: integral membrane sensor hybrid histidine kinase, partial [uncultured bacterium]